MKPIYLEFCGINSFSERAEIDFRKLLEFGIFGIFGDTGSGKSTILDCIGFALYGNVDRSRSGRIADIINYKLDRAYVNYEFEITFEGRRRSFRVERELKRKNASQSVRVYERIGDELSVLADGVRESDKLLIGIVGLEQKDFEKCIAIPQGEFAQFVKAQRAERLKLVSRLFGLEEYGERLSARVKEKFEEARKRVEIQEVIYSRYADYTAEGIEKIKAEIARRVAVGEQAREALERARKEENELSNLVRKRKQAEEAARAMERLEAKREEMRSLNGELDRLGTAAAAVAAAKDAANARERLRIAEKELIEARARKTSAEEAEAALKGWSEEAADEEIDRLTQQCVGAKAAELAADEVNKAKSRLQEIGREYAAEADCFRDFSYEEEAEKLESRLKALGSGDFLSFAEEHGKAALLHGEYAQFARELTSLTEKYPVIADDSAPLIERYSALSEGERTDIARLRAEYDERERARKKIEEERLALEKRKGKYNVHMAHLQQLQTERTRLTEQIAEREPQLVAEHLPSAELEKQIADKREERKRRAGMRKTATEERASAVATYAAAEVRFNAAQEDLGREENRLNGVLAEGGFSRAEEARSLVQKYGDPEAAKSRVERYREDYAAARARCREFAQEDFSAATDEALAEAGKRVKEADEAVREEERALALCRKELSDAESGLERKRTVEKEFAAAKKQAALYERLKKLFEGNKFMEFVAEEYLVTVTLNASGRLLSLTNGRYFLRCEKGAFCVGDNFNGGNLRGVNTLSGGETFLVSLSLALALSAEICARSLRPNEFFFLDEGFGTLDGKLIDTVMDSLELLKSEHFSIGIISHVEELKHRIDRKLTIKKATEKHGSQILAE